MEHTPLEKPSSYVEFLPAFYRQGEKDGKGNFLGRFLKSFEKILSGIDDDVSPDVGFSELQSPQGELLGVEDILDRIHDYFDPLFAPGPTDEEGRLPDFVSYLAGWAALTFNQNWPDSRKRRILSKVATLYKKRGTKEGLSEYLRVFVGPNVSIDESLQGVQIGRSSTVGIDTIVGGAPPFFFSLRITIAESDLAPEKVSPLFFRNLVLLTRQIIDLEKPAHTYYSIRYDVPGIIVGRLSHVGINTLLGSRSIPRFIY